MEFNFEDFKERARDNRLSKWEKIGFPDGYRKGFELNIFNDIQSKTSIDKAKNILDIGCGCSELVENVIKSANVNNQNLVLIDSMEMLQNIDINILRNNTKLFSGRFPDNSVLENLKTLTFDVIIVYSVLQYVFIDQSIFHFIHECIKLLNSGGRLLLGDIPNFQARERFLMSIEGKEFLSRSAKISNSINLNHENNERIDDSVVMSILQRFRQFGCETFLLPQAEGLPFSNRREDILIVKR